MEYVKLEEICTIVSGGTPSRSKPNYWNNGNIPWIKIKDMKSKYIDSAEEFITEEGLNNSSTKMLKRDTILYSIFATLGEVGILKIDACTNQAIAGLSLKEDSNILKEYLYYYLKSKKKDVNNLGRGVAQNNINLSLLRKFKIPVIPLRQQKKIIEVLDNVSSTINNYERELALLDELVKARFVEMFGDPLINSCQLPVQPMTDICDIIDGDRGKNYPKSEEILDDGYCLFLNAKNVTQKGFDFESCNFITREKDDALRNGKLSRGDVVLTTRGTVGNLAFYSKNVPYDNIRINSGMVILRMNRSILNEIYFIELFKMKLSDIKEKIASGSAQPQLPISTMNKIILMIPPLELQNQFASFVKEIDKSRLRELLAIKQIKLLLNDLWFLFY